MPSLAERCRPIELLVLDVDGVLTAGGIIQGVADEGGSAWESKEFHVRDGLGIRIWRDAGKATAILSGRSAPVVRQRAAELGIDDVLQGVGDKGAALRQLQTRHGLSPENIAYIGDDVIDVPALLASGLAVTVADGCPEALQVAHHVTQRTGGRGAVREVIELILRCQGKWPRTA